MKRIVAFFFLVFILFGFAAAPAQAFEIREGNGTKEVIVAKDTVIKGSLLAAANSVVIDGTITGDLYCAGQTIIIRGTVSGDVLCVGQTLDISGVVGGNVRSMGQLLNISGNVKRNVVIMGQTLSIAPTAVISGEMLAAGQTFTSDGRIGEDVVAAGQTFRLNSTAAGNVTAYAETVSLGEKARVTGNFTYTSPVALSEATGAAVTGKISHIVPKRDEMKPVAHSNWMPKAKPWPANAVAPIILYLVVGAIIVLVAREKVMRITAQMLERPWYDGLIGLLAFILAPIAIMMVSITLIGIPLAIIMGIVYAVMIICAHVYVSVIVGNKSLSAVGKTKSGLLLQVIIGVIIVELVAKAPILGALVSGAVTLWGLGGIVANFGRRK